MVNVFAINLAYDTPVKLFSLHLLLIGAALCAPDVRRLAGVLLLNRATDPRDLHRPYLPVVGNLAKLVFVGTAVFTSIAFGLRTYEQAQERPELFGIWDVESYRLDGDEVPPLTTDPARWQSLLVEGASWGSVRGMDGSIVRARIVVEPDESALTLSFGATWVYDEPSGDELRLEGEFDRTFRQVPGDFQDPGTPTDPQVELRMKRRDDTQSARALVEASVPGSVEEEPASDEPASFLLGEWETTSRAIVGDLIAGRRSDPTRWAAIEFDSLTHAHVDFGNGRIDTYAIAVDPERREVRFTTSARLTLTRPTPDTMILEGTLRGHDLRMELTRRDPEHYLLVRRGFHWINEVPLNRY